MTGTEEHFVFNLTMEQRNELERALRYYQAEVRWKQGLLQKSTIHDPLIHELLDHIDSALDAIDPDNAKSFWLPMSQKTMIPEEYRKTAQVSPRISTCCAKYVYRQEAGKPWRCLGCRSIQRFVSGAAAS